MKHEQTINVLTKVGIGICLILLATILINLSLEKDQLGPMFWNWETFTNNVKQIVPLFPQDEP